MEPILQKAWIFGPPFFVSILKVSWTQIHGHPLDFNAFFIIQEYFSQISKFLQIKEEGPNFWGEPILHKVWIILSPLLYFNFKSFMDPNSSPFIRFQCILHGSGVLFAVFWNFYKSMCGDLISRGNQFCKKSELFSPSCCISVLNVLWTQIHGHSLHFAQSLDCLVPTSLFQF